MKSENHFSLKTLNTLGIEAFAKTFICIQSRNEIHEVFSSNLFINTPWLALGGGSNILFTKDFDGNVVKIENKGIHTIFENKEVIELQVEAGEDWNSFVWYCVKNNYYGIENLALIPGNVGSCPIQNIGAYGTEVKSVIKKVEFFNINSGETTYYLNQECNFAYRDSIFKHDLKNNGIILSVTFELCKRKKYNLKYADLNKELGNKMESELALTEVYEAICSIRKRKLPDPALVGNAGSFFKNPTINNTRFNKLLSGFPEIPHFLINEDEIKIPAAWLIDNAGWKGKRIGDAGVHVNQPLVLVNYGNATGNDILFLAQQIIESVKEKFEICLETEVNIV